MSCDSIESVLALSPLARGISSCCAVLQLLINGEFVDATGGGTFETYDPRTGEVLMSVAEATAQDVDKAVQAARSV